MYDVRETLAQLTEADQRLGQASHDDLDRAWTTLTLKMTRATDASDRKAYMLATRALASATLAQRHRDALSAEYARSAEQFEIRGLYAA